MTKQDLIEELMIQRDYVDSLEEWQEVTFQINQLQQEVDIDSIFDFG